MQSTGHDIYVDKYKGCNISYVIFENAQTVQRKNDITGGQVMTQVDMKGES